MFNYVFNYLINYFISLCTFLRKKIVKIKFARGNHITDDKRIFGFLHSNNRCTCQGCLRQTELTPTRYESACMCMYYYSI